MNTANDHDREEQRSHAVHPLTTVVYVCCTVIDCTLVLSLLTAIIRQEMSRQDYANCLVSEGNESGTLHKGAVKTPNPGSNTEKSVTIWIYCICRTNDIWKLKLLVFDIMNEKNKVGRPNRECVDDMYNYYTGKCTQLSCLGVPAWLILLFFRQANKFTHSFIHIEDRCRASLQDLSHFAQDRSKWVQGWRRLWWKINGCYTRPALWQQPAQVQCARQLRHFKYSASLNWQSLFHCRATCLERIAI